jgi:hypothetical protein
MRRPQASIFLGLLLALSLSFKTLGGFESSEVTGPQDVSLFLRSIGFSESSRTAEAWTEAHSGACMIEVMQVSHQGWQRSAVGEYAGNRTLVYFYGGDLYSEHPVIRATVDLYFARLRGYLHLPFAATPVWAVIQGPHCRSLPAKALGSGARF